MQEGVEEWARVGLCVYVCRGGWKEKRRGKGLVTMKAQGFYSFITPSRRVDLSQRGLSMLSDGQFWRVRVEAALFLNTEGEIGIS